MSKAKAGAEFLRIVKKNRERATKIDIMSLGMTPMEAAKNGIRRIEPAG